MIVERTFAWDYQIKEIRNKEAEEAVLNGAICVLTNHDWSDGKYTLEEYYPIYPSKDFKGGYYKEYKVNYHWEISEAEVDNIVTEYLKFCEPIWR